MKTVSFPHNLRRLCLQFVFMDHLDLEPGTNTGSGGRGIRLVQVCKKHYRYPYPKSKAVLRDAWRVNSMQEIERTMH